MIQSFDALIYVKPTNIFLVVTKEKQTNKKISKQ